MAAGDAAQSEPAATAPNAHKTLCAIRSPADVNAPVPRRRPGRPPAASGHRPPFPISPAPARAPRPLPPRFSFFLLLTCAPLSRFPVAPATVLITHNLRDESCLCLLLFVRWPFSTLPRIPRAASAPLPPIPAKPFPAAVKPPLRPYHPTTPIQTQRGSFRALQRIIAPTAPGSRH